MGFYLKLDIILSPWTEKPQETWGLTLLEESSSGLGLHISVDTWRTSDTCTAESSALFFAYQNCLAHKSVDSFHNHTASPSKKADEHTAFSGLLSYVNPKLQRKICIITGLWKCSSKPVTELFKLQKSSGGNMCTSKFCTNTRDSLLLKRLNTDQPIFTLQIQWNSH